MAPKCSFFIPWGEITGATLQFKLWFCMVSYIVTSVYTNEFIQALST